MTDTNTPDNIRPGMTGDATAEPSGQGPKVGGAFAQAAQQEQEEERQTEEAHTDGKPDETRRPDGGVYPEQQPSKDA